MPAVTIVVPTHNRVALVRRAIESALAQTWTDFEILVADDASVDGTREAVLSFADPRVRYLRLESNRGVSAARNTAIENSAGDFIAFLDDDDEWLPEKLAKQMPVLLAGDETLGGVYSGSLKLDRATGAVLAQITPVKEGFLFDQMLAENWIGPTSAVVVRKACLEKVGLFDTGLVYAEDWDLWIRISREFEFRYVSDPLIRFYVQETGLSTEERRIVEGQEALVNKHRVQLEGRPAVYSFLCVSLGTRYMLQGELSRGRRQLWKAVRLRPFSWKAQLNLVASLLGRRVFAAVKAVNEKWSIRSREKSSPSVPLVSSTTGPR